MAERRFFGKLFRRRTRHPAIARATRKVLRTGGMIEALERRQMLTTAISTPGNPFNFTYHDLKGNDAIVNVFGNTTAEFIFFDGVNITDAVNAAPGADLFQVY